jgi:leucyl-tRNA synthetase
MELFIGPWNQEAAWSVEGMGGCFRFLQRVWTLNQEFRDESGGGSGEQRDVLIATHQAVHRVTKDLHEMGFNTAIAALMEFTNELYKIKAQSGFTDAEAWKFALETLTQLLAPFAPHIAEELWEQLGKNESVHMSDWPKHDDKYLQSSEMTIVVQVNGKVRANVEVPADANKDAILEAAKAHEKVAGYIKDGVKKEIYVPNKLVNFVV